MSAAQYVQATGIPAIMYGAECCGVADTTLRETVGLAAAAVSPRTRGKNARLTMHATAAVSTATDPSYSAHIGPIKAWATAYWDAWASRDEMAKMYKYATHRIGKGNASAWTGVQGPATVLVAICNSIGWRSGDGRMFYVT